MLPALGFRQLPGAAHVSSMSARLNVDEFATVNRRTLLRGLRASALLTTTGSFFTRALWAAPAFSANPFALGVASGDPAPDGFVLWTKIAPKPLDRGGGMPMRPVEVNWAVATSDGMQRVVREGTAVAHPELGHAVHVEVDGLEPARDYFYQFTIGGERSQVGRSRTLPPAGAPVGQVRIGPRRLPVLRGWVLYRLPPRRRRAVRFRVPLRRLYLRARVMEHPSAAGAVVPRDLDETSRSTTTGIATASTSSIPICRRRTRPRPSS